MNTNTYLVSILESGDMAELKNFEQISPLSKPIFKEKIPVENFLFTKIQTVIITY